MSQSATGHEGRRGGGVTSGVDNMDGVVVTVRVIVDACVCDDGVFVVKHWQHCPPRAIVVHVSTHDDRYRRWAARHCDESESGRASAVRIRSDLLCH